MNEKIKSIYPWALVGLLWVVALLNYMDRQMLSTMQQSIGVDIPEVLDSRMYGALLAIFLWIYGCVSPFAGSVADRLSRKWLIVGSLGVWSLVTLLMAYCHTYNQIYWLRGLMGVSEALYIPAGLALIADWFTGSSRSLAIGVHMTGLYMGQALGGFGATMASQWSWQNTFHWFGLLGVAYAAVLAFALRDKPRQSLEAEKTAERLPRENVGRSFAMIFSNVAFWVILFFFATSSLPGWGTKNWLPTLFAESLHLSPERAGILATSTIAASSFVGVMIGGPLSDRWVRKNLRGRIYTSAIGMMLMIPALVIIGLCSGVVAAVAAALLFGVGYGMFDANNMPILCQFVPQHRRATAYGLMNTVGVFMGAVVTQALGAWANDGHLGQGFVLMGAAVAVAVGLQLTMLRPKSDNCE